MNAAQEEAAGLSDDNDWDYDDPEGGFMRNP
jgi:hypothetical protein